MQMRCIQAPAWLRLGANLCDVRYRLDPCWLLQKHWLKHLYCDDLLVRTVVSYASEVLDGKMPKGGEEERTAYSRWSYRKDTSD